MSLKSFLLIEIMYTGNFGHTLVKYSVILTVKSLIMCKFLMRKSSSMFLEWTGKSKKDSLWLLKDTSSLLQFQSLATTHSISFQHMKINWHSETTFL